MDLRAKITDAVYNHPRADDIINAVMGVVDSELDLLRRQLQTARGERPGTWDTWDEHAARKQATPAEPPVKPRLSLEEARLQAARARAHGTD